jgi:hypothetical protein
MPGRSISGCRRWRPRCAGMIRAAASSAAPMRWARWPPAPIMDQGGPTLAANLKCYCRTHHLFKTAEPFRAHLIRSSETPRGLERRWIGQYPAGRVRHRRSLPRQHCVRIAGRQGGCTGTAAGKQGIQQRTELAEDRVEDIHSRGRVRPGRGGNGHWIVDKQRLLRSRPSDPAAKPYCANCGQRERHSERRSGQWPASIRNRKHVPEQGDTPQTPLEHRVLQTIKSFR